MKWFQKSLAAALIAPLMLAGLPSPSQAAKKQLAENGMVQSLFTKGSFATGELIIKYKDGKVGKRASQLSGEIQTKERVGNTELVKVSNDKLQQVAQELAKDPNVAYVEPNYIYQAQETAPAPVNDKDYQKQWGLPAVDAPAAWEKLAHWEGKTREQVVVAVVDTGVAANHPDLAGRVLSDGYNAIDDSKDTTDRYGHGTHVSGIIAAQTNNHLGVAGVTGTANVKILPIKVLGDDGYGTTLSIAKGIDKAVEMGADVINMSLGGQGHSRLMEEAIQNATSKGVLVVVAAGNSSDNADGYFPAGYPEPITVASINSRLKVSSFSNYGSPIDIAAPGEEVLSTVPTDKEYEFYSGTSMATPFVAGAAALVKLTHPDWDVEQVRQALQNTAKDIDKTGFDANTGHGLLQVSAALSYTENAPLHILTPSQGSQVFGQVAFEIKAEGNQAASVQLLDESGKQLGSYPIANHTARFNWDSSQLSDGSHILVVQAVDASGQAVGTPERIQLKVKNSDQSGLRIQVTNLEGKPAHGAFVQILRLDSQPDWSDKADDTQKGYYYTVFRTYANDQGLVYAPSSILLKDEKYIASVEYFDTDKEQDYVMFQPLTGKAEAIRFDLSQTNEVQVQVSAKDKVYPLDHAAFAFVPLIDGVAVEQFAIYTQADKEGRVAINLPPGEYKGYAIRSGETGQNYLLEQPVHVEKGMQTVPFDLSNTKKLTFSLPKWTSFAQFYPDTELYTGIQVKNGQSILVSPQEMDVYWIDLMQEADDKILVYSLSSDHDGLDLTKNQRITVPSTPEIQITQDDEAEDKDAESDQPKDVYHPGDSIHLPYQVAFGSKYTLDYMFEIQADQFKEQMAQSILVKDQKTHKSRFISKEQAILAIDDETEDDPFEEVSPYIVMSDEQGKEVWQEAGMNYFEVPSNYNITDGKYKIDADFSVVPMPLKEKRVTVKEIQVEMGTSNPVTNVTLTSPSREPFFLAQVVVLDEENREVASDFYLNFGEDSESQVNLSFQDLELGKTYKFQLTGILLDNTPILVERPIQIRTNQFSLDLSQKSTRPSKLVLHPEEDLYYEITNDQMFLPLLWFNADAKYAWIDPGSYHLTASKFRGEEQFFYQTDLVIDEAQEDLQITPDFSKMDQVKIANTGKKNTTWLVGVASVPTDSDVDNEELNYTGFELTANDKLYVQPGEYRFTLGKLSHEDGVTTALMYDAQPRRTKDGYEFKVDSKLSVQLEPHQQILMPGSSLDVAVKIQDRYHNRLRDVVVMLDDPSSDIAAPLKLTVNKEGKTIFQALDEAKREYQPISEQEVEPLLTLIKDDSVIAKSKQSENWSEASLSLPNDLEAGSYTLKWETELPASLSGEKEVKVPKTKRYTFKELMADNGSLFDEISKTTPLDQIVVFYHDEYVGTLQQLIDSDELAELLKQDEENGYENIVAVVPETE